MDGEGFNVADESEGEEERFLQGFGDLSSGDVGVGQGELELEVWVEALLVVEVGVTPHLGEGLDVFEGGEHADGRLVGGVGRVGCVNDNPEVMVLKVVCFSPFGYQGNHAFAVDVVYGLGPRCRDFDEDVVLEDFLCLAVDLAIGAEDVQLVDVICWSVIAGGLSLRGGRRQHLPVDLLAYLRRQVEELSDHPGPWDSEKLDCREFVLYRMLWACR